LSIGLRGEGVEHVRLHRTPQPRSICPAPAILDLITHLRRGGEFLSLLAASAHRFAARLDRPSRKELIGCLIANTGKFLG